VRHLTLWQLASLCGGGRLLVRGGPGGRRSGEEKSGVEPPPAAAAPSPGARLSCFATGGILSAGFVPELGNQREVEEEDDALGPHVSEWRGNDTKIVCTNTV
jgi:hypothetical protein